MPPLETHNDQVTEGGMWRAGCDGTKLVGFLGTWACSNCRGLKMAFVSETDLGINSLGDEFRGHDHTGRKDECQGNGFWRYMNRLRLRNIPRGCKDIHWT